SVTGESFNLLSEEVATQVAIRLKADKLIGFCSEQGVTDERGNVLAELFPKDAKQILERLTESQNPAEDMSTGTLRFLKGAISACRAGVPRCHLISYK
ncbi:amino-acid N-acetyltransferase, partial [Vibrio breoganii]